MKKIYWKKKKTIAMYLNRRQFVHDNQPNVIQYIITE